MDKILLPDDFEEFFNVPNARERFTEARDVGQRILEAGVPLQRNPDHAALFCDPPQLVAGPLKHVGYVNGWDARCYPSPVDDCDYINVSARLPVGHPARERGWFDYVAVVHPVDRGATHHMLSQGYGNPFLHHVTWGVLPPERGSLDDFDFAAEVSRSMTQYHQRIGEALKSEPGTLILALPPAVVADDRFAEARREWTQGLADEQVQFEAMQGGGVLVQFFVFQGGRIEVAMRVGTTQTFNPKSVHKISQDEISTIQD